MVANSLGQCGPDCLKFLWITADHAAQTQYGFSLDDVNNNCLNEHIIDSRVTRVLSNSNVACSNQTQLAPCMPYL